MAVPYTFGSATSAIPLSQLDSNFNTTITLGNTAIQLGNTVTTLNNMTFANVTISSVSTPITVAQGGTGTSTAFTAGSVVFAGASGVYSQNNANFYWDNTNARLGIGTSSPGATLTLLNTGVLAWPNASNSYNGTTTGTQLLKFSDNNLYIDNLDASTNIIFRRNGPTESMRIDSSGNLLVGKTAQNATTAGIELVPPAVGNSGITVTSAQSTNAYSGFQMYSTGAAAYRFYVTFDGKINATNTTIAGISDQRLKENIRDLDDGLNTVMALKPRKFDWKAGKGKDIKGDRGFIAQEFEQVFPDLIDEWKDPAPEGEEPYKAVRADLIPVLVKAIQELKAEVDSLKSQLAAKG